MSRPSSSGILLENPGGDPGLRVGEQSLAVTKRLQKQKTNVEDKVSRLEKYEELDKNHPLNKPFQGSASFRGPVFKRKYTNLICVFIFIIFNAAFLFYGIITWKDGATGRLTKGMDFRAEICGNGKLKSRKFLYYASPSIDINVKFCVESCPTTSGQQICLYDVNPNVPTVFCYTQGASTASGLFCLPNEPINRKVVDDYMSAFENLLKRIAGDLGTSFDIISLSLILSFIIAAAFLRIMFDPRKIKYIIWGSIWATVAAMILLAVFFYREYLNTIELRCIQGIDKRDCGGFRALLFRLAAYVSIGVDFFYLLLVMKIFNKINLGVGVLQATSRCVTVFRQLKAVPFVLTLFLVGIAAFFVFTTILGFSIGDIVVIAAKNIDGGLVKTVEYSQLMRYLICFGFLMFQWWLNVILLISDTILAYSLSIWYFEKRKETLILPASNTIKSVLKFHIGTIIMLGLYKIIFRPIRVVMGLLTTVMKRPKQHLNIVRFMQACCLCCIHIHERSLRYQSKQAVVQTAMWSESFSTASKRAWFLLFRNRDRFRSLDQLTTFILFLTKINCSLLGGLFVYTYIVLIPKSPTGNNTSEIETPLAPTVLVFYLGFFFASVFQSAFDIAGKTLLQCYLIDEEMFVGEQRFACKEVLAFIEYHKNDEVQQAKFGKLQQYVKGMKASLNPNVPVARDEDPDEEENKKLERKKKKGSDESGSEEEEEEEEEEQTPQPQKPEKGSDESSSEEDSEEEDESGSEEESEEEQESNLFGGNMFGASNQPNHQTFNMEMAKMGTVRSIEASKVHVGANNNKSNMSIFGKTAISMEKMDESRDTLFRVSGNDFKNNKDDVSNLSMSDAGSAKSQTNLLRLSSNKDKAKDKSAVKEKSHVFGGWNDLQNELEGKNKNKDHSLWKPLESSVISNGSAHSRRPLGRRPGTGERPDTGGSESAMNLMDASAVTHQTKIVEKSGANNNTMRSDIHNVFNKSKIQQSTMKLEYDDDEEDNSKYRL